MDGLDQFANRNEAEQEKGYEKAVVGALSEDLDHIAMAMTKRTLRRCRMPCRSSPPSRTGRLRDRVTQHARGRTGTSHATAPGRRRAGRPAHRRAAVRSRAEEVVRAVTGGGHHHLGPVQPGDRGEVEGPDVGSREQGAVLVPLDRRLHRCDAERGRTTPAAAARRPPCEPAAPSDTRCPRGRPSAAHWAVSNTRLSRPSSSRSRTTAPAPRARTTAPPPSM